MNEGFLGTGWKYSLETEATGITFETGALDPEGNPYRTIARTSGEASIRQSIWLILSTARGERIGRPEFGCGIHDIVFATQSSGTTGDIVRAVEDALVRWEPRIDIVNVDVGAHPDEPNGVLIEILYQVRATNSRFNLVYPFYLAT